MHYKTALALFLGVAAAAPKAQLNAPQVSEGPSSIKINGVSLLGTGCPAGTADVQVDATGELFEATFSAYEVLTGPGTRASDWRKNCKLTLNLEFDRGFQFSIMATDMIGYAEIPAGAHGTCKNTFSFTGQTSSGGIDKVDFDLGLDGHYSGDFDLHADPGIFSWSPCDGSTAILNLNTQCSISPTSESALIAVDHVSGKLTIQFRLAWRPCPNFRG
ncbi:hypothetical protein SAPIO_CDS5680 [Scedosporium apiospermum]|uniref:Secreted protein n=1 Tax=Pseudallescheria apiosperma TaxID=563466 RepID=A0A084G561_PSEDA|nr:uncharacterized protein SAPIO_CDS5680 [Scedosporium apiospermum]KEZ42473.1 hypothetical protein SAPIO_CDS5680 [Scedosporium apiospermum]